MKASIWLLTASLIAALGTIGCDDEKTEVAPSATALEKVKAKSDKATVWMIATKGSKVDFNMDAPKEKIIGSVEDATSGEIFIDLTDLTKTTANIDVDIGGLEIYQRKPGADGKFGEKKKEPKQNEHARTWLQIDGEGADAAQVKLNRKSQFVIKNVTAASEKDISKTKDGEKKVTLTVTGGFLLHQHTKEKTAKIEATFVFKDGKPVSVRVKTVEPFSIGLAEYEVRPRETFGKLAQSTLEVMAPKVAKEARVEIEFTAVPKTTANVEGQKKAKGDKLLDARIKAEEEQRRKANEMLDEARKKGTIK